MLEKTQATPCHSSAHGSPPTDFHPWSGGDPRETYRLLIAPTVTMKQISLDNLCTLEAKHTDYAQKWL